MVMQDDNLKLQPISMALYILELTRGDLDSSKEQLENMQEIKHKPYILDDEMINRSIRLYAAQNEDNALILQQCAIWKKEELTEVQLYQVEEIEKLTHELNKVNKEIFEIVNYCKDKTINNILEKDDLELALEFLTGEITLPKGK
jgi:hypothetical protein